jgi:hypothetical protein
MTGIPGAVTLQSVLSGGAVGGQGSGPQSVHIASSPETVHAAAVCPATSEYKQVSPSVRPVQLPPLVGRVAGQSGTSPMQNQRLSVPSEPHTQVSETGGALVESAN